MAKNSKPLSPNCFDDSRSAIFDRRASPRVRAVCFDVTLERKGEIGLLRARNISDDGIMLCTHARLDPGEPVVVSLSRWLAVRGKVLWCGENCCGIRFDRPIDSAALLRTGVEYKREDRRGGGMRLAAARLATTYAENGIRAVKVTNVSHRGMGLAHDGTLDADMLLRLIVETGVEREARVRWSKDGRAGIRLMEPLSCKEVASVTGLAHGVTSDADFALAN
jgi:hypothetical protein